MNLKTIIVTVFMFLISSISFSQTTFYKINGGNSIDVKGYEKIKKNLSIRGKIEEINLKTSIDEDSIIHYVRLNNITTTPDGFDPWANTKKNIGSKFPIEKYISMNSKNYKNDYLLGRPTFINFWFTKCPPCIKELPILNKLRKKYGDKVNFISITFNNKRDVIKFLKKHDFEFEHIPNSKKQIDELFIQSYPTNLILNKEGIIKVVTAAINEFQIKDIETTINTLL